MEKTIHEGRNVKRIREMLGIKQDALAIELGDDWNQKKISLLEQKETIEPNLLDEVAKALKVPVETIKNFDEQGAVTYFNTFNDNSFSNAMERLMQILVRLIQLIKLYNSMMKRLHCMKEC